jgi:AraC family transcriptional regulator
MAEFINLVGLYCIGVRHLLRRTQGGPPFERIMLDSAALGLACHLLRAHSTVAHHSSIRVGALSTNDFIDDAIAMELGLGDLARATGMRVLDLARSFASADCEKLHGYLNGRRVQNARRLLRQSRMTTDEIAHTAGFKNVAALDLALYFAVGCCAAEYRRNLG